MPNQSPEYGQFPDSWTAFDPKEKAALFADSVGYERNNELAQPPFIKDAKVTAAIANLFDRLEGVAENPRLASMKAQYDDLKPNLKARCSWEELASRLLADDAYYLKLAQDMNNGGVLFGVDKNGNPLFADKGKEPIMCNMNYADTRKAVMFKTEGDNQVETAYEMFPYAGDYDKSEEILMYEETTGEPIVASEDGKDWRSIWLESGKKSALPRVANFGPGDRRARVYDVYPQNFYPGRGVRRLLRVKKRS